MTRGLTRLRLGSLVGRDGVEHGDLRGGAGPPATARMRSAWKGPRAVGEAAWPRGCTRAGAGASTRDGCRAGSAEAGRGGAAEPMHWLAGEFEGARAEGCAGWRTSVSPAQVLSGQSSAGRLNMGVLSPQKVPSSPQKIRNHRFGKVFEGVWVRLHLVATEIFLPSVGRFKVPEKVEDQNGTRD